VQVGEHGDAETGEVRTPVRYEQPMLVRRKGGRLEREGPEAKPGGDDQRRRRNAPRPLHSV